MPSDQVSEVASERGVEERAGIPESKLSGLLLVNNSPSDFFDSNLNLWQNDLFSKYFDIYFKRQAKKEID